MQLVLKVGEFCNAILSHGLPESQLNEAHVQKLALKGAHQFPRPAIKQSLGFLRHTEGQQQKRD
jgi:hypothetical protein